jgi:hypothetical protein
MWIETSVMKDVLWKGHYQALKEAATLLASDKVFYDSISSIL